MMIGPDILEKLTVSSGGRFRLTTLLQKRAREICLGAPALVRSAPERPHEMAIQEAQDGKVYLLTSAEAVAEVEAQQEA